METSLHTNAQENIASKPETGKKTSPMINNQRSFAHVRDESKQPPVQYAFYELRLAVKVEVIRWAFILTL